MTLKGNANHFAFAEYNVENLSPLDPQSQLHQQGIVMAVNLSSPDMIALEEIQDADGPANGTNLSGTATAQTIINAIVAAGGPRYGYVEVAPTGANTPSDQANGNIRNGFLYNTARVGYVANSASLVTDTDATNGDAFRNTPSPLVAQFTFNGQTVTTIGMQSTSRIGSDPVLGAVQPPINAGDQARTDRARRSTPMSSSSSSPIPMPRSRWRAT